MIESVNIHNFQFSRVFGGSLTDVTAHDWNLHDWQTSVESKPHLIGAKLKPISNFIGDQKASDGIRTATCILLALNALEVILEEITFKISKVPKDNKEVLAPFVKLSDQADSYVEKLSDIKSISHHLSLCHRVLDEFSERSYNVLQSLGK